MEKEQPLVAQIRMCRAIPPDEKYTLLMMSTIRFLDGKNIPASINLLVEYTGKSRSTIARCLKWLKDNHYILLTGVDVETRSNLYDIDRAKLLETAQNIPPKKEKPVVQKPVEIQPKYTLTREEIHAKLEAALAKKERAQHP